MKKISSWDHGIIGGTISPLAHGVHIYPALPELILATLGKLREA